MPESNTQTNNCPPDFTGEIDISRQTDLDVDDSTIRRVVASILYDAGFHEGSISIAIVDDPTIHELNVKHLQHDYPTDVLSFAFIADDDRGWLEGEVIVSRDTAQRMAAVYHWEPQSELLLYIIHGTLHLTGMDDATDQLRGEMQKAETRYLASIGLQRPAEQRSPGDHP